MALFILFLGRINCYPSTTGTSYTAGKTTPETLAARSFYLFEVWGGSSNMAKGGYASGILYVEKETTIYVAVGEKGAACESSSQAVGAYNGGGKC